mmetsp:Transcript_12798/g.14689  ORF Transcript_12798/g.14689 Transcript_12798/m.14689 type:complete len:118 (-) Transcript_12798:214-567(-)
MQQGGPLLVTVAGFSGGRCRSMIQNLMNVAVAVWFAKQPGSGRGGNVTEGYARIDILQTKYGLLLQAEHIRRCRKGTQNRMIPILRGPHRMNGLQLDLDVVQQLDSTIVGILRCHDD